MTAHHRLAAEVIRQRQNELAEIIVACQYARQTAVWKPYGSSGHPKSLRDAGYHLAYLAEALTAGDPGLFSAYLAWVKVLFKGLKFPEDVIPHTLDCTRRALNEALTPDYAAAALEYLEIGWADYQRAPVVLESFIEPDNPLSGLARRFISALLEGERRLASEMVLEAARQGAPIKDLYLNVFQRSQREIGRLWQTNQISVGQEHYCTAATQMIMSQLYPYIFTGEKKGLRMVTTCVGGELHEIGARMVADFFEMDGWDTYFLGANTPMESILLTIFERQANLLAISATMTFHVGKVTELISQLRQAGLEKSTKVLVGGYPFNLSPRLWQAVGADGYARDALQALQVAERLMA